MEFRVVPWMLGNPASFVVFSPRIIVLGLSDG
jgi:hypothetical protein